ncbi:23S rRNA (uracil(1939)-C(5))-methyltransferase RlmD [Paenibacillus larvae]|uniref:23S rRNA (Uracil-C(5))-methyltransferase RlmCD n=1 Tax=Paenibacillus larvae subsp. larvae TaxID=147375 RepID=A0A6C0QXJ9_9BACL|nr:23S rRNA (uracil(1939)-C(5))-methyltransferase RlmD [Paenibacillus larvae]QHZ53403.1 23S rRNA (uracil-C(5))-methyltransferase RlmCD [Paenibacillus larvae subsp. larvae]
MKPNQRSGGRASRPRKFQDRTRPAKSHISAAKQELPVEKNGIYTAEVIGIGHDGEGVGRVNGFTLFIRGVLPGEKAEVKVLKVKKQFGYAKLLRVLEPSPGRVQPPCAIYHQCGGCQLQHLSYDGQLKVKRQLVVDNLERIGKLRVMDGARMDGDAWNDGNAGNVVEAGNDGNAGNAGKAENIGLQNKHGETEDKRVTRIARVWDGEGVTVHPTLGMSEPWRYRNKSQVPFGEEEGGLIGGFYAQGSHRIIDMETCLIQHEQNDDVVRIVKETGTHLGINAYNETNHTGLLRHVVVKYGFRTGELMIVLVTNGKRIPHAEQWITAIREKLPAVQSICQNINMARTNVIFGDETKVLWGREVIYDYIGDVKFAISPRSFYQVNPVQTEVLYRKTLEYAGLTGKETVVDAYCGIGTISLFLAKHARKVYGVEIVPEAIEDAKRNAELNGVSNAEFAAGKAEEVLPGWQRAGVRPDVIVVDPPRKGCDAVLLDTILRLRPERVVYVSCNASTLARDLRVLEDGGYRTVEVQPVDMFPHTVHVECVALLIYKGF